jgi:hypothetical protein
VFTQKKLLLIELLQAFCSFCSLDELLVMRAVAETKQHRPSFNPVQLREFTIDIETPSHD